MPLTAPVSLSWFDLWPSLPNTLAFPSAPKTTPVSPASSYIPALASPSATFRSLLPAYVRFAYLLNLSTHQCLSRVICAFLIICVCVAHKCRSVCCSVWNHFFALPYSCFTASSIVYPFFLLFSSIFCNVHNNTNRRGFVRGGSPLLGVWGASQNILLYQNIPQGNSGSRAARATARVAPTGLHCLNVYRAAYAIKQTRCSVVYAPARGLGAGRPQNEHHTMNHVACFPTSSPWVPCGICDFIAIMQ